MLGETVREARIRKDLTQAKLAKLAGVSRRHLAALEKGANVSVNILQRVAAVLDLTEIHLGDLSLRSGDKDRSSVNMPLLADTIRAAREEADRAQKTLARVETLLAHDGGGSDRPNVEMRFPRLPVRHVDIPHSSSADILRERPDFVEIETSGEIRHGEAIDENAKEKIAIPKSVMEQGEIVFRARGDNMRDQGIEDGDLLVVENRPRGRASSGELVIGRIGRLVFVGRWWQKNGQKAILSNGLSEVTVGRSQRSLRVVAAINQIVRM